MLGEAMNPRHEDTGISSSYGSSSSSYGSTSSSYGSASCSYGSASSRYGSTLSSNKEENSKKNAYLKAFSKKVNQPKGSIVDNISPKIISESNTSSDLKNITPSRQSSGTESVPSSRSDYYESTGSSSSVDFSTKDHKNDTFTSDSVLCYVCHECVPSFKLFKHLLFGTLKCQDCKAEFYNCDNYQLLNSPKTSFIPSLCLHKNLRFVDVIDFLSRTFSGSDKHITKPLLDYIKSLSSIYKINHYNLAIKECKKIFGTQASKIINLDAIKLNTRNSDTIHSSSCAELHSETQSVNDVPNSNSDTINSSSCAELHSETQSVNDVPNSNSVMCYVCGELVPQLNLCKHLLFGSLKCQDCETEVINCNEIQLLNDNKNNFTPLCLHNNFIFAKPICFLKSNFFGPNSHKNKLLLEYVESIISIRKIKPYYYLAFKECKKLKKNKSYATTGIANDNSIKEPNYEIKHTPNLSISEYNNKEKDSEKYYLQTPDNGNYLIVYKTIESCPMCYRKLKHKNASVNLYLWIYTFTCPCELVIYYIPPTPANIKHPVWVEEF